MHGAVGLGSVLSDLITGSHLLAQSRRQDAREDRLGDEAKGRVATRRAELEDSEAERRFALDSHWRDARYATHLMFLRTCQRLLVLASWDEDDIEECREALWTALPDVQVLGLQAGAARGRGVDRAVRGLRRLLTKSHSLRSLDNLANAPGGVVDGDLHRSLQAAYAQVDACVERFLAVARRDLGIQVPVAGPAPE